MLVRDQGSRINTIHNIIRTETTDFIRPDLTPFEILGHFPLHGEREECGNEKIQIDLVFPGLERTYQTLPKGKLLS